MSHDSSGNTCHMTPVNQRCMSGDLCPVTPVNHCWQDAGEIEATHSDTQTSEEWLKTHSVDSLQLNLKNLMDKSKAVR